MRSEKRYCPLKVLCSLPLISLFLDPEWPFDIAGLSSNAGHIFL
jgi:hypothetical protein